MNSNNIAHLRTEPSFGEMELEAPLNNPSNSELSQSLFKSLNIESQLTIFSQTLQKKIRHNSLRYQNSALKIDFIIGKSAAHTLDFDLELSETPLGTISISRKKSFYADEITKIETSLYLLHFPLKNAVLYRQALQSAFQDPLTGVNNRTAFDQMLPREIKLAQRHKTPTSLLVVDLDRFKSINDNFGHQAGDKLLRELTDIFHLYSRETDLIFRYGGDEFVIALSNTDQEGAKIAAQRIQREVANNQFTFNRMSISVSVSIGVTQICADDDLNSAFCRADEALYKAKRGGRNKVAMIVKKCHAEVASEE